MKAILTPTVLLSVAIVLCCAGWVYFLIEPKLEYSVGLAQASGLMASTHLPFRWLREAGVGLAVGIVLIRAAYPAPVNRPATEWLIAALTFVYCLVFVGVLTASLSGMLRAERSWVEIGRARQASKAADTPAPNEAKAAK